MSLTVGSVFSGIGGIDLGLQRAGFEIKWQVEIDEYCTKVLGKHWPHVARHGDIRECGAHNLTPVDLICGGFPCQDISNAGTKAGITGSRSGLWSEFYRIICELRPSFVLVENVAALLVRGIDIVLGDLAACGYDAEWQVLPAAAFGAPHLRERVFIVAYTSSKGLQRRGTQRELRTAPRIRTPAIFKRGSGTRIERSDWWQSEPKVGRMAHGIPSRVDRLRGLGNSVVPQIAEYIGKCILNAINEESEIAV